MTDRQSDSAAEEIRFAPGSRWIDVSCTLEPGMVIWPGDPPFTRSRVSAIENGDEADVSRLDMGAHTGTHIDAPAHFRPGGAGADAVSLDALVGPARVVEIADPVAIRAGALAQHQIAAGERILFKTGNSRARWGKEPFREDFVHIAPDAAALLAACRIRTVGVDYLSVGGFRSGGAETHRILLGAGIAVIEGLCLFEVPPGRYWLACLPLKIAGSDGAPARAVLRRLGD